MFSPYHIPILLLQVYLLGLVDAMVDSFGEDGGTFYQVFPEGGYWKQLYASVLLVLMLFVVMIGAEVSSANCVCVCVCV